MDSIVINGESLKVGDFCYIANTADASKPTIVQIRDIWKEEGYATFYDISSSRQGIKGHWYLRPEQTVHKASTKVTKIYLVVLSK